jgi:hypothetical protein
VWCHSVLRSRRQQQQTPPRFGIHKKADEIDNTHTHTRNNPNKGACWKLSLIEDMDPTHNSPRLKDPSPTTLTLTKKRKRKCIFAAVGDVHGQFSKMIQTIQAWERANTNHNQNNKNDDNDYKVDFVLQVGDLEPHRHDRDLASMAMPSKHRALGDFHKLDEGEISLPWPTYFIGGNHEPWEFLDAHEGQGFALLQHQQQQHDEEHPEEGLPSSTTSTTPTVARASATAVTAPPNLYFLGRSSVTTIGPLRVAALSGIDGTNTYRTPRPHVSQFPFMTNKAYIHFTETDVLQLVEQAKMQHEAERNQ